MDKSKYYRADRMYMIGFILCAALFILGCVAGAIASGALPPETPINEYASSIAGAAGRGFGSRFLSELRISGKFYALTVFFALSVLGAVAIPAILALRGFLLCFAVTSVIRRLGTPGVPYALMLFAPEALIALPGLFLLSTHSMVSSVTLLRLCMSRGAISEQPYGGVFIRRVALCAAIVCMSALIDAVVAPWLTVHFPIA